MTPDKTDNNQKEIVKKLRAIPGVTVVVGKDDILVGRVDELGIPHTYWFEIKSLDCISKKTGKVLPSRITPGQKTLLATYTGHYEIVWTPDQIFEAIGLDWEF